MKLTNRQVSLVVDMIFDKVKEPFEAKIKKENEDNRNKAEKLAKKSSLYAVVENIFKNHQEIESVEIKDSTFHKIAGTKLDRSYDYKVDVKDTRKFIESVKNALPKTPNPQSDWQVKKEIEKQVLLNSLDTKDLSQLIEQIAKTIKIV